MRLPPYVPLSQSGDTHRTRSNPADKKNSEKLWPGTGGTRHPDVLESAVFFIYGESTAETPGSGCLWHRQMRARGGCAATQFELMLAESRVTILIHQMHSELLQPKSPVPCGDDRHLQRHRSRRRPGEGGHGCRLEQEAIEHVSSSIEETRSESTRNLRIEQLATNNEQQTSRPSGLSVGSPD